MLDPVITYFTEWTSGIIGESHLWTAMLALVAGAVTVFARKGTKFHVTMGYVYLASMIGVNGTAFLKYDLTGSPNLFHAAAFASSLTIIAAYGSALRYRFQRDPKALVMHGIFMIWSYFGLVVALFAEIFTRSVPFMLHGDGGWLRFSLALGAFMAITGYATHRYIQREIRRHFPSLTKARA